MLRTAIKFIFLIVFSFIFFLSLTSHITYAQHDPGNASGDSLSTTAGDIDAGGVGSTGNPPNDSSSQRDNYGRTGSDCNDAASCNVPAEPPPPVGGPSLYQITGTLWVELNNIPGMIGDIPVYNVPIILIGANGVRVAYTDVTGNYWFSNVSPGTYYVQHQAAAGYTNITPASNFITISNASQKIDFGVKPIPPSIHLPSSFCTGGIPQMTIPFTNGWYPATRYDIFRQDSPPGPGTWFNDIGTNPASGVWFSGDPGGTFFVYDDTVQQGKNYNYFLRAFNDRWSNYLSHPVDSIHGSGIDIFGTDYTGQPWSGYQLADCPPVSPNPNIELWLNGQPDSAHGGPVAVTVDRYAPANLTWRIRNVSCGLPTCSCTKSGAWTGPYNPVGNPATGIQAITTLSLASKVFSLACTNASGTTSNSIQLNINAPKPYIKTTGGDVHTNESISIPQ